MSLQFNDGFNRTVIKKKNFIDDVLQTNVIIQVSSILYFVVVREDSDAYKSLLSKSLFENYLETVWFR